MTLNINLSLQESEINSNILQNNEFSKKSLLAFFLSAETTVC
jgi:hypothetical protein